MTPLTQVFSTFLYFSIIMIPKQAISQENKIIPNTIKEEALTALSYYPELKDTNIVFKFKDKIKKSTMQAQPTWGSFLKRKKNR